MTAWRYAGASVIGTAHLKRDNPECQDAHICAEHPALDLLFCVASDGAGSAARPQQGSAVTVEFVAEAIRNAPMDIVLCRAFAAKTLQGLRIRLQEQAAADNAQLTDYNCTLLVAIIAPERAAFWQIGDGALCFRPAAAEELTVAFWPYKGEYANVTRFLTGPDAEDALCFHAEVGRVEDLAVFTDGIERLALDFGAHRVHQPFLTNLLGHLRRQGPGRLPELEEQMSAFLASARVTAETSDDKTLVLATRVPDGAGGG